MKTTAAIGDSQACSNAAHRWIGNYQRCSCRRPHSAPSIAPSSSPNNRNRLANLTLPFEGKWHSHVGALSVLVYGGHLADLLFVVMRAGPSTPIRSCGD